MTNKCLMLLPKKSLGIFTPVNMVFRTSLINHVPDCMNETVMFRWCKDGNSLVDKFPIAKTVFFNNIGYKFLYHNMIPSKFPEVKKIFIDSHPGDSYVVHRFSHKPDVTLYITSEYYNRYLGKWWNKNISYIKEISDIDYNEMISNYIFENPKYR